MKSPEHSVVHCISKSVSSALSNALVDSKETIFSGSEFQSEMVCGKKEYLKRLERV